MSLLKRLKNFSLYFIFLFGALALYNYDKIIPALESIGNNEKGILLGSYERIAFYFQHADTWNILIGSIVFVGISLLFVFLDSLLTKLFKIASITISWLSFTQKAWFNNWVQKGIGAALLLGVFVGICNIIVTVHGNRYMTSDIDKIKTQPALILGTSKYLKDQEGNIRGENLYFKYRIDAALDLWKNQKVSYFILSGDRTKEDNYDETQDMAADLIKGGVPLSQIKIDTAGYRTLDSMLRLRGLFQLSNITVVTQDFQLYRALFQSWFYGLNAQGYIAQGTMTTAMVQRETVGARPKVVMDLFLFNMQPKVGVYEYREAFAVKTDLHLILVLLVIVSVISVLGVMFKVLENEVKGRNKYLITSSLGLVGSILIIITVYKNQDIDFVDNVVESFANTTGIKPKAVQKKEQIKILKASIANKEIEPEPVPDIVEVIKTFKEKGTEISPELQTAINEEIGDLAVNDELPEEADNFDFEEQKQEETGLFGLVENEVTQPVKENPADIQLSSNEIIKEEPAEIIEEEKEEEDPFGLVSNSNGDDLFGSNTNNELPKSLSYFDAKVIGSHRLNNNDILEFRLTNPLNVNGNRVKANTIFEGRISIFEDKSFFVVQLIDGKTVQAKNYENTEEGTPLSNFFKTRDGYRINDGTTVKFGYYQ